MKAVKSVESKTGRVSSMLPSPVDPNMVIFLGTEGINWITESCGASVRAINT